MASPSTNLQGENRENKIKKYSLKFMHLCIYVTSQKILCSLFPCSIFRRVWKQKLQNFKNKKHPSQTENSAKNQPKPAPPPKTPVPPAVVPPPWPLAPPTATPVAWPVSVATRAHSYVASEARIDEAMVVPARFGNVTRVEMGGRKPL